MKLIHLEITQCKYCPFLKTDGVSPILGICRNSDAQKIVEIQAEEIPEWCPLDDVEEPKGKRG